MRMAAAVFTARNVRLLVLPSIAAFAAACEDAPLPHEPSAPANVLISSDVVPTRQQVASLTGARYWADGYVWSSNVTSSASFSPTSDWAFNVAANRGGSPITVTKPTGTTGQYIVTFPGLSAWLGSKTTVRVSAESGAGYGVPDDVFCKPVTAHLVNDKIDVRCFRGSGGGPINGAFRLLATRNYLDLAFAYAHLPANTNYAPEAKGSWNSGGPMTVVRHGVGRYEVIFSNLGPTLPAGIGGHVQVNAVGTSNRHCKMENSQVAIDVHVWVRCLTPTGVLADSKFTVLFASPAERLAYTIAHQPSTPSYAPLPTFSWNPSGGAITITRQSAGKYRVQWAGVDPEINGFGNIQVTGWGTDNSHCKVYTLNGLAPDFVDVLCYNPSGAAVDAKFTVLLGS
jgi:hypothetical protein